VWNREIGGHFETVICKLNMYFKPTLSFKAKPWVFTKRKKSKIQAVSTELLRSSEEDTRKHRIVNVFFLIEN
jgi:hypothetical protein